MTRGSQARSSGIDELIALAGFSELAVSKLFLFWNPEAPHVYSAVLVTYNKSPTRRQTFEEPTGLGAGTLMYMVDGRTRIGLLWFLSTRIRQAISTFVLLDHVVHAVC